MSKSKNTEQNISQKSIVEYVIVAFIFMAMIFMIITFSDREFSYKQYNNSTLQYVRGRVVEVLEEELSPQRDFVAGFQRLKVEILEGTAKGEIVEIDNYITAQHNVILKEGARFIVCADIPENVKPVFSVYNYDRSLSTFVMIGLFLLLVIIIGKKKGFMSCVGLLFSVCTVICFLLPNVFEGGNAIAISVITVILSTIVSCFCISGLSKKTVLNILSTVLGTVSAGIVYLVFMLFLNISGSSMSEAETLVMISNHTGLQINGLLIAGLLVSSLGAVMDVAVSIGASLHEIKELNPKMTPNELFRSGMNIGKDMIGTMTNTLILAFTGGTFATLIVFLSYGLQFNQLISSNFLALEIATGISGSAAVVLTVPISAAISAFVKIKK